MLWTRMRSAKTEGRVTVTEVWGESLRSRWREGVRWADRGRTARGVRGCD